MRETGKRDTDAILSFVIVMSFSEQLWNKYYTDALASL